MTKSELIAMYAKSRDRKRKDAEADVNFIFDTICASLAEGEKVVLTGFGTFDVRDRKEKTLSESPHRRSDSASCRKSTCVQGRQRSERSCESERKGLIFLS